ncbi:MAG: DsbC family protein [Nitrospirae bacterium]|nr:MAG: DsbC family protein [Nitrospirota bacterium]
MRKILLFTLVVSMVIPAAFSFGFSSKDQDCAKCHTLKKEEAATILKDIIPNIKVKGVQLSPLKAMWEIEFEADNKKGLVYLDVTKKYAVSGSIIDIKGKKNVTQERYSEVNRVDVSKIPLGDAILLGSKDAKIKVIVFTDPDCPFCSKLHKEMKKVVEERKDIAFQIKMFPLPTHKGAYEKSKAIVCGKSLALLEEAFEKKPIAKAACKTTDVDKNIALAKKLGFNGTPVMVLPNGRAISGFREAAAIKELVDKK